MLNSRWLRAAVTRSLAVTLAPRPQVQLRTLFRGPSNRKAVEAFQIEQMKQTLLEMVEAGNVAAALVEFSQIRAFGAQVASSQYEGLLQACLAERQYDAMWSLLTDALQENIRMSEQTVNRVLGAIGSGSVPAPADLTLLVEALQQDGLPVSNNSFILLIRSCLTLCSKHIASSSGLLEASWALADTMLQHGFAGNRKTWTMLVSAFADAGNLAQACYALDRADSVSIGCGPAAYADIVQLAAAAGAVEVAQQVYLRFLEKPTSFQQSGRGAQVFVHMTRARADAGDSLGALGCLRRMVKTVSLTSPPEQQQLYRALHHVVHTSLRNGDANTAAKGLLACIRAIGRANISQTSSHRTAADASDVPPQPMAATADDKSHTEELELSDLPEESVSPVLAPPSSVVTRTITALCREGAADVAREIVIRLRGEGMRVPQAALLAIACDYFASNAVEEGIGFVHGALSGGILWTPASWEQLFTSVAAMPTAAKAGTSVRTRMHYPCQQQMDTAVFSWIMRAHDSPLAPICPLTVFLACPTRVCLGDATVEYDASLSMSA